MLNVVHIDSNLFDGFAALQDICCLLKKSNAIILEQACARGNSCSSTNLFSTGSAAKVKMPPSMKQDLFECLAHLTSGTPNVARDSQRSVSKIANELEEVRKSSDRSLKKRAVKEAKMADILTHLSVYDDITMEALSLQEKLETCCKQHEYGAINDLEQEVLEKYKRFRRAAPEVAIIIMQNLAVLAYKHGQELESTGNVLEAIKAYELNLQCCRNVDGDDDAEANWPGVARLVHVLRSTVCISKCYRQLGLHDRAKSYLCNELGECLASIADLSSDPTEREKPN